MNEPVEPAIPQAPGAEPTVRAGDAMFEARREASVILAFDAALFCGLAAVDHVKDWSIIGLPPWVWLVLAAPALILIVLLLAVPLADVSPGRLRTVGFVLL